MIAELRETFSCAASSTARSLLARVAPAEIVLKPRVALVPSAALAKAPDPRALFCEIRSSVRSISRSNVRALASAAGSISAAR
jgi:hypothetical protein